jgi:glycogen debranching enzyme
VGLDELALPVPAADNRPVSFTNKRSAYYYTQSHRNDHPEHAWFRGLNLAGRRVFNDLRLHVDGKPLDPEKARVTVTPEYLERLHPGGLLETLRLFDEADVLELTVHGGGQGMIALQLTGDQVKALGSDGGVHWYESKAPEEGQPLDHIGVARTQRGFMIAVGPSRDAVRGQLLQAEANHDLWQRQRRARLEGLINGQHALWTDDPRLTRALRWTTLTMAELVTRQRGEGIYAGLPWFNEYWGRDSFISLTGATLVTGQFETARAVLMSFAQFQDLDPKSPFHGRVPNIVKVGSIDYHTTDGTPRFIIALHDYVRYSGDRTVVKDLYPNIVASIEGALKNWTDASGYLVHKDNETWMDARRASDLASYSPRATRANDIQALWHAQLLAGAEFARMTGDEAAATRWAAAAERVRVQFTHDFVDAKGDRIADHLKADGGADFTLRPNQLFALDLCTDRAAAARCLRKAWEGLVFPWGVTTLDPKDPFFHPFHLAPGLYHKDEAYHNGAVWPWLNGIAMQRLLEHDQPEPAWTLFQNMNSLVLERGVVGGLPENLDAYPHSGDTWPRLTGTFLQAWSNAEQLRVWYQHFLGLRPDLLRDEVLLAPRLPFGLNRADVTVRIGAGTLRARHDRDKGQRRHSYALGGLATRLVFDLPPYEKSSFQANDGDTLEVEERADGLQLRLIDAAQALREEKLLQPAKARLDEAAAVDPIFDGMGFAAPKPLARHPVMRGPSAR